MKHYPRLFFGAQFSLFVLFLNLFLAVPARAFADVKINEVAWMGTTNSQYSEWLELYNNGSDEVSLTGWKLYKTGGTLLFTLSKTIAANGYLLIERTTPSAPDAVSGINDESGTFSGGGLKNSGDDLILKDKDDNTIDSLLFASGWPGGDAKTKDTMQWDGQKWITAAGTPDAKNAVPPTKTDSTPLEQVATPQVTQPVVTDSAGSPQVQVTVPVVVTSSPTSNPLVVPVITATKTVSTPVSISPIISTQIIPIAAKSIKASVKSTSTKIKTAPEIDPADDDTSQLQDIPDSTPKENNHIKIIVLAVVAFIGMALLLLLRHVKASQE